MYSSLLSTLAFSAIHYVIGPEAQTNPALRTAAIGLAQPHCHPLIPSCLLYHWHLLLLSPCTVHVPAAALSFSELLPECGESLKQSRLDR
jgi:hypothetical protein